VGRQRRRVHAVGEEGDLRRRRAERPPLEDLVVPTSGVAELRRELVARHAVEREPDEAPLQVLVVAGRVVEDRLEEAKRRREILEREVLDASTLVAAILDAPTFHERRGADGDADARARGG